MGEENKVFLIGCGNLSLVMRFKTLRENRERKTQIGQYLLAVGLSCYTRVIWNWRTSKLSLVFLIGWRGEQNIPYKGVETSP